MLQAQPPSPVQVLMHKIARAPLWARVTAIVIVLCLCIVAVRVSVAKPKNNSQLLQSQTMSADILKLDANKSPTTVFLVRTFHGHFDDKKMFNIMTLINSLQAQVNQDWVAFLLNTDTTPLPFDGHQIVDVMAKDRRIRHLNLPVAHKYDYWEAAYELTDQAIAILADMPEQFGWMVITNGDNFYEPRFLSHLTPDTDIILVGYWSRWWKDDVKVNELSATKCYQPQFKHGFVDLGGAIISLPRFAHEGHKFAQFGKINSQDGIMFFKLSTYKWRSSIVSECLFSHAPSPWGCHKAGGVWSTAFSSWSELSDSCLTQDQVKVLMKNSFPKPIIEKTPSGMQILSLPEPYQTQRHDIFWTAQKALHAEFNRRVREYRTALCEKIRASGYQVDPVDYKLRNTDLKHLSNFEATNHFWSSGCLELRALTNIPEGYFLVQV